MSQKNYGTYDDSSDSNNIFIIALVINEPPFLRKTGVILELFGILLRASFTISVVTSILVKILSKSVYISARSILEMSHWGVKNTDSYCSERILVSCDTSPFLSNSGSMS